MTIDDSERPEQSNRRMAENIQTLEGEKDAKIAHLERQVRSMEENMSKINYQDGFTVNEILDALIKSPKADNVSADVLESFTSTMRQVGAGQGREIRNMRAEYNARIDTLQHTMDRMVKEGNFGHEPPAGSREDGPDGGRHGYDSS